MARKAPAKKAPAPAVLEEITDPQVLAETRQPVSIRNIRIGQQTYPVKFARNCPVCTHPARVLIEERILTSYTWRSIADWVNGEYEGVAENQTWPELQPEHIRNHYRRGHSPLDAQVIHDLNKRATGGEVDYTQVSGRIMTSLGFAQRVAAQAEDALVRGELKVTAKDGLAANALQVKVDLMKQQIGQEDQTWYYEQAFALLHEIVYRLMTPDQWDAFTAEIRTNSTLKMLAERKTQQATGQAARQLEDSA